MSDILYTYHKQVYANITNKCDCNCKFCIRNHGDSVGEAKMLWHKADPSLDEILQAMDAFDFTNYQELVYCGYGEPTCAFESLIASAKYAKEKFGVSIRVNTNGLANLYHKKNIVPELAEVGFHLHQFKCSDKRSLPGDHASTVPECFRGDATICSGMPKMYSKCKIFDCRRLVPGGYQS